MTQWQNAVDDFDSKTDFRGPSLGRFPRALSSAPIVFTNDESGEAVDLRFVAGLFGVVETALGLEPEMSWAVVYGDGTGKRFDPLERFLEQRPLTRRES